MLTRGVTLALVAAAVLACAALARAGFESEVDAGSISVSSALLTAPGGVEASSDGCESGAPTVDVSWDGGTSAAATGYAILRSTSREGPFVEVGSVGGNGAGELADTNALVPSSRYWYVVEATAGGWTSPASDIVAVRTPQACD